MSHTFLTIEEVAELFRVPIATLYHWRCAGIGPPSIRPGKRVLYRRADVDSWIDDQFNQVDAQFNQQAN